jgi:hypothetical protein
MKRILIAVLLVVTVGAAAAEGARGESTASPPRIDVGVVGLIPIGSAREYYSLGGGADATFTWVIARNNMLATFGAGVGAQYFTARGALRTSHAVFVPFFAEAGIAVYVNPVIAPTAGLRFGATVANLISDFAPGYTAVMPFVAANAGVTFDLGRVSVSTGVAGEYHAEDTIPLWFLSPTLSLDISL